MVAQAVSIRVFHFSQEAAVIGQMDAAPYAVRHRSDIVTAVGERKAAGAVGHAPELVTVILEGQRIPTKIDDAQNTAAIDAIRERKYRKKHEVTFSDLSPQEENQLYTCDKYFVNDEAEKSFFVAGKEITAKQLADALHSLPEEKRQAVLLYYFFDMKDAEIAELMKIPRSTVQFRRTSSFELLKIFLEESR